VKLDADVSKLVKTVSIGCFVMCAVEILIAAILRIAGLIHFYALMIIFAVLGTAVVVGCFFWMASSLQKSLDAAENGGAKVSRGVQAGYNKRRIAQALWMVAAIFVPQVIYGKFVPNITISGILPLLFPAMVIYVVQLTGRFKKVPDVKGGET